MPRTVLHQTRFLNLCEQDHWFFAERPNAPLVVGVVAVTPADELILVEQFRIPVQRSVIELPAGLVGDECAGEDPALAAARELEEETGWRAGHMSHLTTGPSSAGLTSECMALYRARDLVRVGTGGGVAGERITVHTVPLAQIRTWLDAQLARNAMIEPKIFAALYFAQQG
jgi:ADP-ribose pyrophosphatase